LISSLSLRADQLRTPVISTRRMAVAQPAWNATVLVERLGDIVETALNHP
jgi:hypothetical protein